MAVRNALPVSMSGLRDAESLAYLANCNVGYPEIRSELNGRFCPDQSVEFFTSDFSRLIVHRDSSMRIPRLPAQKQLVIRIQIVADVKRSYGPHSEMQFMLFF